jgi:hypothetical protein
VPPVNPAGAFIAKYTCWSMLTAATRTMIATKLSVSIEP